MSARKQRLVCSECKKGEARCGCESPFFRPEPEVKRVPTMTLIRRLVRLEVRGATAIFQPASSKGITLADCIRQWKELDQAIIDARRVVRKRVEDLDRLEW